METGDDDHPLEHLNDEEWASFDRLADEAHVSNQMQSDGQPQEPEQPFSENARDEFLKFCWQQIDSNTPGWDIRGNLPWQKDVALDKKAEELNLSRRQGACLWLYLKRAKGNRNKIEVTGSSEALLLAYNEYTQQSFEVIRATTIRYFDIVMIINSNR